MDCARRHSVFHTLSCVRRSDLSGGAPQWLLALMRTRDYLVQPFLAEVARRGELCLVYVNGELLHAVHKDPAGWGTAEDGITAEDSDTAVATANTSNAAPPATSSAAPLASSSAATPARPAQHACALQCVRLVVPLEAQVALAGRAIQFVSRRCGGTPY